MRTVRFVKCAQELGFSLEEIDSLRQLVATCDRSPNKRECPILEAIEDDTVVECEFR